MLHDGEAFRTGQLHSELNTRSFFLRFVSVVVGPTQSYDEGPVAGRWVDRVWVARGLRFVIWALPVVASYAVVWWLARELPPRRVGVHVLWWWVLAGGVGALTIVLADRGMRRFLPVVALLRMSMVFPDRAPSRFRAALRSGSARVLERRVAAIASAGPRAVGAQQALLLLDLAAALSRHDRFTRGHCERVRAYSDLIAEELGLAELDRDRLRWAALLHDVGKLEVPAEILNKPGRPSDGEWKILAEHPGAADRYLSPVAGWLDGWQVAASQHHERWDGGGYPVGLSGEQIHLAGRIVAVADAYDTMVSVRSYKKAMTAVEARTELSSCAGGQFDPRVVRAFLNVSIGRVRRVAGGLTWFGNLGQVLGSGTVSPVVSSAPSILASGALFASALALTVGPSVTGDSGSEQTSQLTTAETPTADVELVPTRTAAVPSPAASTGDASSTLGSDSDPRTPSAPTPTPQDDPGPLPSPTLDPNRVTSTPTLIVETDPVAPAQATTSPTETPGEVTASVAANTFNPALSPTPAEATPNPSRPSGAAKAEVTPQPTQTTGPSTSTATPVLPPTGTPTATNPTATPTQTPTATPTQTPLPLASPTPAAAGNLVPWVLVRSANHLAGQPVVVTIEVGDRDRDGFDVSVVDVFGSFETMAFAPSANPGPFSEAWTFVGDPLASGAAFALEFTVTDDGEPPESSTLRYEATVA